jgi:hypothetical protein
MVFSRVRSFAPLAAAIGIIAISDTGALVQSAVGHTHLEPDGTAISWYPRECCHDRDCRPVVQIQAVGAGLWMTTDDGQTVLIGPDEERRPSLDLRWHVCLARDHSGGVIVQCVFQPPSS